MATELKARPTEYKGIRFRSKSEAVFARCLDLSPVASGWIYEPFTGMDVPHQWDFSVVVEEHCICHACRQHTSKTKHLLIELKPSEPTRTYIDELIGKTRETAETRKAEGIREDTYIVWGSPWERDPMGRPEEAPVYAMFPIFSSWWKYGWGNYVAECQWTGHQGSNDHFIGEILGISEDIVEEAKTTDST